MSIIIIIIYYITECKMMGGGKSSEKGRTVIQCHYIKMFLRATCYIVREIYSQVIAPSITYSRCSVLRFTKHNGTRFIHHILFHSPMKKSEDILIISSLFPTFLPRHFICSSASLVNLFSSLVYMLKKFLWLHFLQRIFVPTSPCEM